MVFLLLNLPAGIGGGFLTVTVPFLATRAGLPVAAAASIVAVGLLPQALKILWSPVADLALTLKSWYRIGAAVCGGALLVLSAVRIGPDTKALMAAVAFLMLVGVTLLQLPVGAFMALAVPERIKGRAAGWYQVGHLGGMGVGGGAGVWLASHVRSPLIAGVLLGTACLTGTIGLRFVPEPARAIQAGRMGDRILDIGRQLRGFVRSPNGALTILLVVSPIGVGAAANLWSAVAPEWHVSANLVALVTGAASAGVSALGCLIGGWWADHADRRVVYLATGGLLALVGVALALAPRTPIPFAIGTLAYALALGMCFAAFSALVLAAIGRGAAASKYTMVAALGNAPISYMTAFDGWVHDRWSTTAMLGVEALGCAALIGAVAAVLPRLPRGAAAELLDLTGPAAVAVALGGTPSA